MQYLGHTYTKKAIRSVFYLATLFTISFTLGASGGRGNKFWSQSGLVQTGSGTFFLCGCGGQNVSLYHLHKMSTS